MSQILCWWLNSVETLSQRLWRLDSEALLNFKNEVFLGWKTLPNVGIVQGANFKTLAFKHLGANF